MRPICEQSHNIFARLYTIILLKRTKDIATFDIGLPRKTLFFDPPYLLIDQFSKDLLFRGYGQLVLMFVNFRIEDHVVLNGIF